MWKLKLDAQGHVVLQDGKPVYIKEDGSEIAADINQMTATIASRNAEAKQHREAKEAAEAKLATFGDIDPAKAKDAFDKLSKIDQAKLIDAGKVDEVRSEVTKAFTAKVDAAEKKAADAIAKFTGMTRTSAFNRSEFVTKKIAVPVEMVEATFGKNFQVDAETGKIKAVYDNGTPIYSPTKPGEEATFDEAIGELVKAYPHRDRILVGANNSGSGAQGGSGGGGGTRTMKLSEFQKLDPLAQSQTAKAAGEGKVVIQDD